MQPVIVLPAQYFSSPRIQRPEHELMIAVLRDAFECIENNRFATDSRCRRLFREAETWFFAGETDWPYSFEGICSALDLDTDAIRQRLCVPPESQLRRVSRAAGRPV
jgi:hypothetical protein